MEAIISVKNVKKSFKNQIALDNVSMNLERGKIYGLVGRNGSGKTVLLKCICGLMHHDEGEISVNKKKIGTDIDIVENVGAIIENPGFIPNMSGLGNLKLLLGINKKVTKVRAEESMAIVGLDYKEKNT